MDVCFLDSEDRILKEISLPNDITRATKIKQFIQEFADVVMYDAIIISMESTFVYSFHPATFLSEDADLKELQVEVVVQNPKAIARFKGLFDEDKTDEINTFRIADFLRLNRYNTSLIKEDKYMVLQRLTRSR